MFISTAPIVLFVFARPEHTRHTLESLAANALANQSDLIVYSDAARNSSENDLVKAVRSLIDSAKGFRSVRVINRETNFGLARNITNGVTEVLRENDRVIVLEDDMITSPHFLAYMNEALERYANDERVASIHGYVFPTDQPLPEAFFLPGADCWGWATWRRSWACFNLDGQYLLDELKRRKLIRSFDFNGAYPYLDMLKNQIEGKNDSWAIRWYASAFLADKLTLYPGRSLVRNIGIDGSGTHCGESDSHDVELSKTPIDLSNVEVVPSHRGRSAFEAFFRKSKAGLFQRVVRKVRTSLRSSVK